MNIFIMGGGNLGTAFAKVLSKNNKVYLYDINAAVIEDIKRTRQNKKYLPGIHLNNNVIPTTDLSLIKDSGIILMVVPSMAVAPASKAIKQYYSDQLIISTSKGLSSDGLVMTDVIEKSLGCPRHNIIALSGPCIANELAREKPTLVMLGGESRSTKKAKKIMESETFFIRNTTDIRGIQLLGFYKNIIALLVGICEGLKLGNNFESALVSKAYSEFYYLNIDKNIRRHTFIGPAGLGDLYVTAMSSHSRNRRFGLMLGQGMHIDEIRKKIGQTIEGYDNLLLLEGLKNKSHIDNLLAKMLIEIITGPKSSEEIKHMLTEYLYTPEIKNIIFDWGNVLTKGNYSMNVAGRLSKIYGLDAKGLFKTLEHEEKKALFGTETFNKYFKRIKRHYPKIRYDIFLKAYKDAVTYDMEMVRFCKGLKKDYDLYLLSNNYSIITPILKKSVFKDIFTAMIFSNEIHLVKPRKDIFQYMLTKHKIRAENCLFIDDSGRNVAAARENKINVIKYHDLRQLKNSINSMKIG